MIEHPHYHLCSITYSRYFSFTRSLLWLVTTVISICIRISDLENLLNRFSNHPRPAMMHNPLHLIVREILNANTTNTTCGFIDGYNLDEEKSERRHPTATEIDLTVGIGCNVTIAICGIYHGGRYIRRRAQRRAERGNVPSANNGNNGGGTRNAEGRA
ncbi:hypothetical protein DL98DRAFT_56798 [Cadophora sp. DSE1049]|nr:hypothetical protein DL98DRAFT_56798 [Cadophora sp. DSE1049]